MNTDKFLSRELGAFHDVKAKNLIPHQQESAKNILRSADCYQQKFIKFPHIGIFHSYAELLHAALLEANSEVSAFVPQPFLLYVGNRRYPPDCYYTEQGLRIVVEIKPRGELKDELLIPVKKFFEHEGIIFKVISNEEIFSQEILAVNWLKIIRTLVSAANETTYKEEISLLNRLFEYQEIDVGDIVFIGDRIGQRKTEIALFRLAHKGKIKLDLSNSMLSFATKVSL